ncbi:hypothetical protein FDF76_12970 [Clostridium botulinum]|nr:hypothetical protein [Clostridium botulinum]NFF37397.1 hypothetical protein [Clostridium botulinum]NFI49509.1 hypothetical protein [Clostridium botulinum]NFI60096.1 hypothetical protein [Clostridium botulinum]NFI69520.1 hypothetical protein [Clostridium botulinum]
MEYISAKEFLKQPVEVQEVFIDWWKPSEGDLVNKVVCIHNMSFNKVGCIDYEWLMDIQESEDININDPEEVKQFVLDYIGDFPLLTEGQLRKFIEDKTGCKINIDYYKNTEFQESYRLTLWNDSNARTFIKLGTDLLQAYWKVACEIAKEE